MMGRRLYRRAVLAVLVGYLLSACTVGCKPVVGATKDFSSSNGEVTFKLPTDWESMQEGQGMAYVDAKNGMGTLRLIVETANDAVSVAGIPKSFDDTAKQRGAKVETLLNGARVFRYDETTDQGGTRLNVTTWQFLRVGKSDAQVAIFSYTLPQEKSEDPRQQEVIQMLDGQIRACVFK